MKTQLKYIPLMMVALAVSSGVQAKPALAAKPLPWQQSASQGNATPDKAVLADVSNYLNHLTTIQSDFVQVAPDGSLTTGKFYLQRPGKMRWQYDPPVPVLMVSTGKFLTYYDYELEQITNIPLDESLAGFLARPVIDLNAKELKVLEQTRKNGVIRIKLTQTNKPDEGELTLELADKPMVLRNLIIKDAQGQTTNVSLNNARYGVKLNDALFVPPSTLFKKNSVKR